MYTALCTSYTEQDETLVLLNNWTETFYDDSQLLKFIDDNDIDKNFRYPIKGSVSGILIGRMSANVLLHVRIVNF